MKLNKAQLPTSRAGVLFTGRPVKGSFVLALCHSAAELKGSASDERHRN